MQPLRERGAGASQKHRNRRGIGRRGGGPGQKRGDERQAIDQRDKNAEDGSCDSNPDRGQHRGGPEREPQHGDRRLEPALEQDHRERHAADQISRGEVVIGNAEHAVLAREHAEREKDEQHRRANAPRDQPGNDAQEPERPAQQDQLVRPGDRRVTQSDQLGPGHLGSIIGRCLFLLRDERNRISGAPHRQPTRRWLRCIHQSQRVADRTADWG